MKTARGILLFAAFPIAVLGFLHGLALADGGGGAPTEEQNLAMLWPMLGLFLATFAGWGVPRLATAYSFFHTPFGAVIIGLLGALVGSVIPIFQSGHVTWVAIVWAAVSGGTAFFARLNPSATKDDPPAKSPAARPNASVLLPLVFLALGSLAGCATCTTAESATCARKILTGIDAIDGAGARVARRWVRSCGDEAKALAEANKLAESDAKYTSCEKTGGSLVVAVKVVEDATQTASDGVDVAEKAGRKDYEDILQPVRAAVAGLRKVFADVGITLPSVGVL